MKLHLNTIELEIVKTILKDILREDAKVYVFGSRASGKNIKPFSDLDLAVDLGRPLAIEEEISLKDAFSDSDLRFKVDVIDLHQISPKFKTTLHMIQLHY